jgi:hypothetical protein
LILFFTVFFSVLGSIDLDDQSGLGTIKIYNIGSDRLLTIKLNAANLFCPQPAPESTFSLGHALPKTAGEFLQFWIVPEQHARILFVNLWIHFKGNPPKSPFSKGGLEGLGCWKGETKTIDFRDS